MVGAQRLSARAERWNTWGTALLLLALATLVNRVASRDLRWRRDLSEDQLYAISDGTRTILGRLEDKLLVKTYFTGEIESGDVSLAKARVEGQLDELIDLAGGWIEVVRVDPASSTAALQDTRSYGIAPQTFETVQGTQRVVQPVYLGLLLRYRGREEVIRWADPWGFEVQFATAVHALLSERSLKVGWYEHTEAKMQALDVFFSGYETARSMIARRAELVRVPDLRDGDPRDVLDDLDVLFVVRPREEHPRAAFELEQFVRRGGKLVLLVDQADYNALLRSARPARDGSPPPRSLGALEQVLYTWRMFPLPATYHVWDMEWQTGFNWLKPSNDPSKPELMPITSPAVVTIVREGFERTHPITAGLQRVTLSWAQPLTRAEPPPGIKRVDLLRTSGDAYNDEVRSAFVHLPERVQSVKEKLLAGKRHAGMPLAAAFTGVFPAVFEAAPAPWDPILDDDPKAPLRFTDEELVATPAPGTVVVFGDADWLRDDRTQGAFPFLNAPGNQVLLMNVLDWLALDEELIALRRKSPLERGLRDFEKEALVDLGVYNVSPADTDAEARRQRDLRDKARSRARAEEWRRMLLPLLVSLGLVFGFGLIWNLRERRGGAA